MNASTVDSTLASIAASSGREGHWVWIESVLLHLRQTLGIACWGMLGLLAALSSYAFGVAAIIFGVLWHLRVEEGWVPALISLGFGYVSARGSLACMSFAFASGQNKTLHPVEAAPTLLPGVAPSPAN